MTLTIKRILAFTLDYLLIILYASLLLGITLYVWYLFGQPSEPLGPIKGQLLAFFTLTLPVFLYFYLSEKSAASATWGKRKMRLSVVGEQEDFSLLKRNIFKLLPWEVAHTGVHWSYYLNMNEMETPLWIWILLIVPQVVVIIYIGSVIWTKGRRSLYDVWAGTSVIIDN